jgi:hypothetical protein
MSRAANRRRHAERAGLGWRRLSCRRSDRRPGEALQQVLHPASLAVFSLVEPLRPAVGQVGDDVAGVDPIGSGFDPGDDPALAVPGLGPAPEVHVAAELELGWLGRAA